MDLRSLKELGLLPVWREKSTAGLSIVDKVGSEKTLEKENNIPMPAVMPAVNKMQWIPLREAAKQCTQCTLSTSRKNVVFGVGDQKARVFFVGEAPGRDEDLQGEPFVGAAGKLLDQILFAINLSRRENVYIANVVKCRPPSNRTPTVIEARACLTYLKRQIALVCPKLIVALGKTAASHLIQSEVSIGQLRQKLHEYEGIPLVVTYHPAYLLRSPEEKRKAWHDFCFIRHLLEEESRDESEDHTV